SCAPSGGRYGRAAARSLCGVASGPSAANGCRTRDTVGRQTPRAAAVRSSGQASGPSASALGRRWARARAVWVPVRIAGGAVGDLQPCADAGELGVEEVRVYEGW